MLTEIKGSFLPGMQSGLNAEYLYSHYASVMGFYLSSGFSCSPFLGGAIFTSLQTGLHVGLGIGGGQGGSYAQRRSMVSSMPVSKSSKISLPSLSYT